MVEVKGLYESALSDLAAVIEVALDSDALVLGIVASAEGVVEGDLLACRRPSIPDLQRAKELGASSVFCEQWPSDFSIQAYGLPVIKTTNYAHDLGIILGEFYHHASSHLSVMAVTGTNGKTTVAYLCASALQYMKQKAYYIGTLGFGEPGRLQPQSLTTPGVAELHTKLAHVRDADAQVVTLEASSHGLDQGRLSGVMIDVAVFTNLTHDHLDYHGSINQYLASKRQLFEMKSVGMAVINIDDPSGALMAEQLGYEIWPCGIENFPRGFARWSAGTIMQANHDGILLKIVTHQSEVVIHSSLVGRFHASNLLLAHAALCMLGTDPHLAAKALESVSVVPGRMQKLSYRGLPSTIYVDYCHTPVALEKVLSELQSSHQGKLILVFGCGGDRDREKRPMMGEIAERYADQVIVTQDNSRSETFSAIAEQILSGMSCPGLAEVVACRYSAIERAMNMARAEDIILLAGKGHEKMLLTNHQKSLTDFEIVENILLQG